MTPVSFTKMHGLGNDFMVIDNRLGTVDLQPERVRRWADRHTGIGFDQLLVVSNPSIANVEFDYRIFNADGDEVEHCGNGARCFARYVTERGFTQSSSIRVNTSGGVITLELRENGDVTVYMGVPVFTPAAIPFIADEEALYYELDVDGETLSVGAAGIGNPHVVLIVDDVASAEVERLSLIHI